MNGSVIIDASLSFKWMVEEEYTAESRAMLIQWRNGQSRMLVPSWFLFEIVNALYQRIRRGELTTGDAAQLIEAVQITGVEILDYDPNIHIRALELAHQFRLNAAYDAHYLALAEQQDCELWTADERLWNSTRAELGWVRWVGELSPNSA